MLAVPGGKAGVLTHSTGLIEDRAFQFKVTTTMRNDIPQSQVIGLVLDDNMNCVCYAYEYDKRKLIGPFEDNIAPGQFKYGGGVMATPSYEALGIKLGG